MKLRTKIQLFSSLFMLILILLINTSIYFLFYKISSEGEIEQLTAKTDTMVEALQADLPNSDLLEAFLPGNGMIRVYKEDESEPIVFLTKQTEYGNVPGVFENSESRSIVTTEDDMDFAVISRPIIWEDGSVVTLQVAEQLIALKETMRTLFFVLVIASLLMLIPTIIAGRFLSQFLLRPIRALTETMKVNTADQANWQKIDVENRSHDELYEMEQTFNEMIERLKENYEKQEVFVSDASHELKTPISIVKSYAQLMHRRGDKHPELISESVQAINTEADRMQQLVEQLLLLVKNENDLTYKSVDIVELCEKTVATFRGAYTRSIQFKHPSESVLVHGNEDQLRQVIYILLDNALKYSADDIEVTITLVDDDVNIRVHDYGPGISEEEQKHIFDRFYRIDKARNRETGGTGLGLAIAKTISLAHDGDLVVESKLGSGTTFQITLPIIKEQS